MTITKKIELESIFLISLAAIGSLYFVVQRNNQGQFNFASGIHINSPLALNPTKAPRQNIFSQISPDGTKKVIMEITQNSDNTQTYTFFVSDDSELNKKFIFEKNLDDSRKISIPFNTFSSDNKYFFIQESLGNTKSIYSFKVSGESFSETEKYIDVTDLFAKKNTGNNFSEATGWASESLILINTTKPDGSKGPSYWFEVPSKAIIQLSTKF